MEFKSEKDVKRAVKQLLDKHDFFWWMPAANGYGKVGTSDFNAIKNGVFLAIETKFGSNGPTPMQTAFLGSIIASQGFGFVVNEKNLSFLEQWLEAFDGSVEAVAAMQGGKPEDAVGEERGALMINAMVMLTELIR